MTNAIKSVFVLRIASRTTNFNCQHGFKKELFLIKSKE